MSAKLKRSDAAFSRRVLMGRRRVWMIVEGRGLDPRFYDRVLRSSPKISELGYRVQLAEQIQVEGVSAGGKAHVLRIHDSFRRRGMLGDAAAPVGGVVFFAVDKDIDDVLGVMRRSPWVIYTIYADVEAEIYARGRLKKALADAAGLQRAEVREVYRGGAADPLERIAEVWFEWLLWGCVAQGLGVRCRAQIRGMSALQNPPFGPVDEALRAALEREILTHPRYLESKAQWISQRVRARAARGALSRVVKGKHVAPYLETLLKEWSANSRPVDLSGFRGGIAKVMLSTVRFDPSWTLHWIGPIETALETESP